MHVPTISLLAAVFAFSLFSCGGKENVRETGGASSGGGTGQPTVSPLEEWDALTAPRPGPSEIWTKECEIERISSEYGVRPNLHCQVAQDYGLSGRFNCDTDATCRSSTDCTDGPRGRCEGVPSAYCTYPNTEAEPCTQDADCTTRPSGSCALGDPDRSYCWPDGTCLSKPARCGYPTIDCRSDADCESGGTCLKLVSYTECYYDTCMADSDCDPGKRCGCSECVESRCDKDADCGEGQRCVFSNPGCLDTPGYYCTTLQDECVPDDGGCVFRDGRFQPQATCGR